MFSEVMGDFVLGVTQPTEVFRGIYEKMDKKFGFLLTEIWLDQPHVYMHFLPEPIVFVRAQLSELALQELHTHER